MLGQEGRRDPRGGRPLGSVLQAPGRPSILRALRPRSPGAGGAGRIDQAVDGALGPPASSWFAAIAASAARALRRSANRRRSDAAAPALEHVGRIDRLAHQCGTLQTNARFRWQTDPAQVVFQIARVKMSPLTVPGKNGIAQPRGRSANSAAASSSSITSSSSGCITIAHTSSPSTKPSRVAMAAARRAEPTPESPDGANQLPPSPSAALFRVALNRLKKSLSNQAPARAPERCRQSAVALPAPSVAGAPRAASRFHAPTEIQERDPRRARAGAPGAPGNAPLRRAAPSRDPAPGAESRRSDLPGRSSGNARSISLWPACRPASSPSRQISGSSASCTAARAVLRRSRCRARDGVGEAGLGQRDHVHIALGDDHHTALADRRPGERQAVQQLALAEGGRLRGVQVFGARAAPSAGRRTHHPAALVLDRKHDPDRGSDRSWRPRPPAATSRPASSSCRLGIAFGEHGPLERRSLVRRVADAEARDDRPDRGRAPQILGFAGAIQVARDGRRTSARRPDWRRRWSGRPGLALTSQPRSRQSGQLGQTLQRLGELDAFDRHHEVDRVAVLAAAEAVVEALVGTT